MANYGRELRIGANIRKKKNRKDNGVCKKNEESARRDESSIKKSAERNKKVGR